MAKTILETARLLLRPIQEDDAEAIFHNWASDDEVTKYLTWPTHKDIETTKAILSVWLEEQDKPGVHRFGIVLKQTNELIGMIDVVGYPSPNEPEIGYSLSRKYWNNGYMTEACQAFIAYLFEQGYSRIHIDAIKENIGSNKVIAKCGFVYQGTITRQQSNWKPVLVDINRYLLIKE